MDSERITPTSVKEDDLLDRSRKKKRGNDMVVSVDAEVGFRRAECYGSYKDSLLGYKEKDESNMEADRQSNESFDDDFDRIQEDTTIDKYTLQYEEGIPSIKVSAAEKKRLSRPWKNAKIVKLLGRSIGYNILLRKLQSLWQPKGQMTVVDLGEDFYLVKFWIEDDLSFVLHGGPWLIFDHYLTIRKWQPDFDPSKASIERVAVWVRFPSLPIEYYDSSFMKWIKNVMGNSVRVDSTTEGKSRGKYARLCVEVDLSKPLMSQYILEGEQHHIEYEGIHLVCFECGCYGHRKENCKI